MLRVPRKVVPCMVLFVPNDDFIEVVGERTSRIWMFKWGVGRRKERRKERKGEKKKEPDKRQTERKGELLKHETENKMVRTECVAHHG